MDMEDDLRKLKCPKDKDPKELLADMTAIEVKYKYKMTGIKKAAAILQADAKDYSAIMAMTSSMEISAHSRKATAAEYITEMHRQYRNTNGSRKKHQKITNGDDYGHKTSLAEVGKFKQ